MKGAVGLTKIVVLVVVVVAVIGIVAYVFSGPVSQPSTGPGIVPTPTPTATSKTFKIRYVTDMPVTEPIAHMYLVSLQEAKPILEKDFPNVTFDVALKEEVTTEDWPNVVESLSKEGANLIFTNLAETDILWNSAQTHKDIVFMQEGGTKQEQNLGSYDWKWNEGQYVLGSMAAYMTKTKKVGFIQAILEPGQIAGANSFYLGVQSVDPNVEVLVTALGSWYDPVGVATIGKNMISLGADVMYSVSSGLETLAQRGEKFLFFGNFVDWAEVDAYNADYQIMAAFPKSTPYVVAAAEDILAGTWSAQNYWWGVKEVKGGSAFTFSPYHETASKVIPPNVKSAIEDLKAKIGTGEIEVKWLTDPIYK